MYTGIYMYLTVVSKNGGYEFETEIGGTHERIRRDKRELEYDVIIISKYERKSKRQRNYYLLLKSPVQFLEFTWQLININHSSSMDI